MTKTNKPQYSIKHFNMKKITTLTFCSLLFTMGMSQTTTTPWNVNGNHISNPNTGGVGIGTNSPLGKLDVRGLFNLDRPVGLLDNLSAIGIPVGNHLAFAPSNMSASNNSFLLFTFPNNNTFRMGTAYDGHLGVGTYRDLQFGRYDDPYVTIKDGGNVGIGVTNPDAKLHIEGSIKLMGSNALEYFVSSYGDGFGHKIYGVDATNGRTDIRIAARKNTATWTDIVTFIGDGRVGIGTMEPGDYKLAVNGKVVAKEIKVKDGTPWPDYVFSRDYNLMSLTELEAFIKKNNHLPNIPSAQEVKEKEGIELGVMNAKLLEKIEEMTLHIINMNKEIQSLKKEVKDLSAPDKVSPKQ
jgi:hypothetical protein